MKEQDEIPEELNEITGSLFVSGQQIHGRLGGKHVVVVELWSLHLTLSTPAFLR